MKKNNNISRRNFLLVEYISEVLKPSRRAFGGVLGGAFSMALGINPNKSQARSLNKIEEKIKKIAKKFLNVDGIKNSIFIVEGRILKFEITLEDEEVNEIILNENEALALSNLTEDYLDKIIKKINLSSEGGEDAFYNIKDFIDFLGQDYKKNKIKKTKRSEIEEIDLDIEEIDLDSEETTRKKVTAEQFKEKCELALENYKTSHKLEFLLLQCILKNCTFKRSKGYKNKFIITRNTRLEVLNNSKGETLEFYNERDILIKKLKKIGINVDIDRDEPDVHINPLSLYVNLNTRPKEFIKDYINCISDYLKSNRSESDEINIYNIAFQFEPFNISGSYNDLKRKYGLLS